MSSLPLSPVPPVTLSFGDDAATPADARDFGTQFGLLPREKIEVMQQRKMVWGQSEIEPQQLQPASLDLRLGSRAYRVRASFLPGKDRSVADQLAALTSDEFSLEGQGAVLERGCVYVIPLLEHLKLTESFSASANPKSSTGRLDIFTRLITDRSEVFDTVERGYEGPLYAEVSPRSFSVRVRKGSRLNQIRFRRWHPQQFLSRTAFGVDDRDLREHHARMPLVDGELNLRGGIVLRIALARESLESGVIGYRAQKHADVIDVDRIGAYDIDEFWEPLAARNDKRLILDPGEFYILASREKLHIPPDLAAEMVPIDPSMGEFRVHYAGFFDPGFGFSPDGHPGSRAVLEVRSHEVPFILEDGQVIGRLVYEKMSEAPQLLYGQSGVSNYQGQGLKLSKHFAQ
ncbi:MAG: 2'-deoxycytidine 5'-triphosphate deaminase [Beijerinckiaceae bacterium]|nr:MAG: 2'-deoxycytidine 5'-triphosphate deaminase [Beijerinckiaceae bacterium]